MVSRSLRLRFGSEALSSVLILLSFLIASPAGAQVSFDGPDIPTGRGAVAIATADFNRDGKPDIVTANRDDNTISVLLNIDGGVHFLRQDYPTDKAPSSVLTADFNGDGIPDVAVASSAGVTIFLGAGDGTLRKVGLLANTNVTALSGMAIVSADFNHDGKSDLAVLMQKSALLSSTLAIYSSRGDGTFSQTGDFSFSQMLGVSPLNGSIVAADFNNDGAIDLAVNPGSTSHVTLLLGAGNGTFQHGPDLPAAPLGAGLMVAADFNSDGKPDLIVQTVTCGCRGGDFAGLLYLNNGDGTFRAGIPLFPHFFNFAAADFNNDGVPDLVGSDDSSVRVNLTNPSNLAQPVSMQPFPADFGAPLAVADFNGDGVPDIAVVFGNSVSVLLSDGTGNLHQRLREPVTTQAFFASQVLTADLNGDGIPDVLTVSDGIWMQIGNADASFPLGQRILPGFTAQAAAVGDLNGDGIPDLVISGFDQTGNSTRMLLGKGDGTFSQSFFDPEIAAAGQSALIADFTGHGKADVAYLGQFEHLTLLQGKGDGTFDASFITDLTQGGRFPSPAAIVAGDFDRDGKLDVLVCYSDLNQSQPVNLFRGNGDGTFAAPISIGSFSRASGIAAADFNRDGVLDFVVALDGFAKLYLGNGDGTFEEQAGALVNSGFGTIGQMQVADVNGDGFPDLIITHGGLLTVQINNGDGTFQPGQDVPGAAGGVLAIADFNHDGAPDIVVAGPALSFYLNTTPQIGVTPQGPPDFKMSLSPNTVTFSPGESVSVFGKLTSTGLLDGPIEISCSGLPQGGSCSFNPGNIVLGPNRSMDFLISVSVTKPNAASSPAGGTNARWAKMNGLAVGFGLPIFGLLSVMLIQRPRPRAVIATLLLLICLPAFQGCGSITQPAPPPQAQPANPAGAYLVTVTAVSSKTNVTHAQTITVMLR